MQNYKCEHEHELSKYPLLYTQDMALANRDIIKIGIKPHNSKRMQLFMHHFFKNEPDKITITNYDVDGYPTISILQYTGEEIIYTTKEYIDNNVNYCTYYGKSMSEKYRKNKNKILRSYNLITFDHKDILIYTEQINR